MGNEQPQEKNELKLVKSLTISQEKNKIKNDKAKQNNDKKEFIKFRNYMLKYQYYKKILKLGCKKNPVLKLLYLPDSSFNDYNLQMFYILEDIPYVNYQECLQLTEFRHSQTYFKKQDEENSPTNLNKNEINLNNNNNNNNTNTNPNKMQKKTGILNKKSSFKASNKANIKKVATFDLSKTEQFNHTNTNANTNNDKNLSSKQSKENIKTFNEGLLELIQKICLYDLKKIQKILLIYPINNIRWLMWLGLAKVKYNYIENKINISNKDIYQELSKNVDFSDDSLMFELHNTLKELKIYKYNWSNSLYQIIKCLILYEQNMKYENGLNILIGVPLLISDCNEEETFFFGRYLLSTSFGLGLYYFYDETELLLNYLVFIFHYLAKEKFPKIYEHLNKFNISDDLWIKKWIKTFFSSIFDLSITIRVWDCVISVGIKFLVNYSLAILDFFEEKIMDCKKVKEFLEFFDYDLRKKYLKDKEIISFREKIISLAQSYYIPDGKYQLMEKEYLDLLFQDKNNKSKESVFDTSKTINNYYSNNASLNDEQYQIKLILRSIIYIPSELIKDNDEEQNILTFRKRIEKNTRRKSKTFNQKIINEKDKELLDNESKAEEKKEHIQSNDFVLYSSLGSQENKTKKEKGSIDIGKTLISKIKNKLNMNEEKKEENLISVNESKNISNIEENKNLELIQTDNNIINNKDNGDIEEDEIINYDFKFNDEQIPTS